MTNGSKYRKKPLTVFDLRRANRKKAIENARVILLFCHKSDNTLYRLIMNIAVIVGNQQATMRNKSKYCKESLRVFISAVLTKKY